MLVTVAVVVRPDPPLHMLWLRLSRTEAPPAAAAAAAVPQTAAIVASTAEMAMSIRLVGDICTLEPSFNGPLRVSWGSVPLGGLTEPRIEELIARSQR